MSNPASFISNYASAISQFIVQLNTLRSLNDQLNDDPTLVTRYFSTSGTTQGVSISAVRTDISSTDVANASSAIGQMLFTFSSGNPTQGSLLYKMTP